MVALRVLVADDDDRLTLLVSRYLSMEGYEVETVADGLEAVERAVAVPPALVILDIMMPGIDGIQACHRIRTNPVTRDTPILIFTALGEEGEAARLAGADALLKKPFSLPVLGETVRRLCQP
jgi:CheY-like chemotaxis protein